MACVVQLNELSERKHHCYYKNVTKCPEEHIRQSLQHSTILDKTYNVVTQ